MTTTREKVGIAFAALLALLWLSAVVPIWWRRRQKRVQPQPKQPGQQEHPAPPLLTPEQERIIVDRVHRLVRSTANRPQYIEEAERDLMNVRRLANEAARRLKN